ncbi:PAS domain-containing protein [Streptomyces sp. NPDC000594]|uniref:PAS domain-containing protein n=1 Tax=Streptomyces sp. NPDC000594 TaxID=3154261 RepID=UPI0033179FD0
MSSRPSRGAARLAAILDALPDGLVLVNCNGTVVNANTIALELFETPGTALVGRGLLDLLPSFDSRLIPGSMRRPEATDERGRTKPTRMMARRTDGVEFPVEVTSAGLEDGRDAYASRQGYTGDELLMLVVRDLSGTLDTEAELARSRRQTEMILRAAAEGVVGTDTEGRVVLVNPAAAQILGYRASDLGGRELHPLILHSREDGKPFPYAESPLADTLRSGRKHRVRGQVLWSKDGSRVPVDLTTAPVRDGDQLVGAVMTFTDRRPAEELAERHAAELAELTERLTAELTGTTERLTAEIERNEERYAAELADRSERYATEIERRDEHQQELTARHEQLTAVLGGSLRGPLEELRTELGTLADDPAGQLWPEANQILHHLAAGYARMTTLIDNVLGYQRLDTGQEALAKTAVPLDAVVAAGVEGAIELIGPGRAQFAVHAPAVETEVDPRQLATALAHLAADVAGVDSTGKARLLPDGGYVDSTVVIAAAQRGEVVRIEVRGPFVGGDPVHEPIVRGIVEAHGGVLQTHEMPGMSGSAYVLEVPLGKAPEETDDDGNGSGNGHGDVTGDAAAEADGAVPADGTPGAPELPSGAPVPQPAAAGAETPETPAAPVVPAVPDADVPVVPVGGPVDGQPLSDPSVARPPVPHPAGAIPPGVGRSGAGRSGVGTSGTAGTAGVGTQSSAETMPELLPEHLSEQGEPVEPAEALTPAAPLDAPTGPVETGTGRRRARRGSTDAFLESPVSAEGSASGEDASPPTGRRRAASADPADGSAPGDGSDRTPTGGTGRRRGRPSPAEAEGTGSPEHPEHPGAPEHTAHPGHPEPAEGAARPEPTESSEPSDIPEENPGDSVVTAAEGASGRPAPGHAVPPGGVPPQAGPPLPVPPQGMPPQPGTPGTPGTPRLPGALSLPQQRPQQDPPQGSVPRPPRPVPPQGMPVPPGALGLPQQQSRPVPPQGMPPQPAAMAELAPVPGTAPVPGAVPGGEVEAYPGGRRTRRALAPAPAEQERPGVPEREAGSRFALPPAAADRPVPPTAGAADASLPGRHDAVRVPPGADHTPAQHHPLPHPLPTGRRRARPAGAQDDTDGAGLAVPGARDGAPVMDPHGTGSLSLPLPEAGPTAPAPARQPLPAEAPRPGAGDTQGRAFSVRALGQGGQAVQPATGAQPVPGAQQPVPTRRPIAAPAADPQRAPERTPERASDPQAGTDPQAAGGLGSGRRRRLAAPPEDERPEPSAAPAQAAPAVPPHGPRLPLDRAEGRAYAIGAPDVDAAEGPEPLDGPGGAVEVANRPQPHPVDDELPPEPLDNPRRLLVWPAPDVSTQQALSDRGYRPVVVHSREEVDAQIAAFPAALFVDPLTGPITRTALQSLRQAAVAAEVPVLVTAGLGQATREAAYGADPAVLLKALAPRDSEQHPSRVLLIEEHEEIALALTSALERRGTQVARAGTDAEAVALAAQTRPNLVVMDLMQVRRRRAGIIDWLRANGQLNRTPLVVYTSAGLNRAELPRLSSGETVLFLAERSTSAEVQSRIVDLLAKIGTN